MLRSYVFAYTENTNWFDNKKAEPKPANADFVCMHATDSGMCTSLAPSIMHIVYVRICGHELGSDFRTIQDLCWLC